MKEHGTYAGYVAGCRKREQCPVSPTCTDAERRYQAAYSRDRAYGRPRKVPAIGGVRRVQALMAIGWSRTYIAQRLGMTSGNVRVYANYPTMRTWRADAIKSLYVELLEADIGGPSERTITLARMNGFLPPPAWEGVDMDDPDAVPNYRYEEPAAPDVIIDEVAIQRAIRGERIKLTQPERLEALRLMRLNGETPTEMSRRLRIGGTRVIELIDRLDDQSG